MFPRQTSYGGRKFSVRFWPPRAFARWRRPSSSRTTAATLYTENINRALELAVKLKAGVVWINTTNQLDAACGFGGIRESGFGREGGLEGMLDYVRERDAWQDAPQDEVVAASPAAAEPEPEAIDRTFK